MLFAFSSQKLDVCMHAGLSADQLPQSNAFEELLEVMTRAVAKFNLDWLNKLKVVVCSMLDDRSVTTGRVEPPNEISCSSFISV